MTKAEKLERLAALERRNEEERKELSELRKEIENEHDDGKPEWLALGDRPWRIESDGTIMQYGYEAPTEIWEKTFEIGNVFPSAEQAKSAVERLKILAEMQKYTFRPNWEDTDEYKWYIYLDNGHLRVDYMCTTNYGMPTFDTVDDANDFIKAVGEDRLMKYWFYE